MTQENVVLTILKSGKSVTSFDMFQLGITRLSSIIHKLRNQGYKIETETITGKNRFNHTTNFGRYWLKEDK